jgi:adenylate cyclase
MAEAMPPEAVVAMLREFHQRMADQIFDCGGTIEKYIGDEIFAVFGLPDASPHDALMSLRCAALMLRALDVWNDERTAVGEAPLALGIGLNYGPAVLGDVGTAHNLAFTVIGDTVNIASRLQNLTRELETPLVVADSVLKQIGGGQTPDAAALPLALEDRGERELRGRTAAIRIWTPSGA